jgi:hypothetical protein
MWDFLTLASITTRPINDWLYLRDDKGLNQPRFGFCCDLRGRTVRFVVISPRPWCGSTTCGYVDHRYWEDEGASKGIQED